MLPGAASSFDSARLAKICPVHVRTLGAVAWSVCSVNRPRVKSSYCGVSR